MKLHEIVVDAVKEFEQIPRSFDTERQAFVNGVVLIIAKQIPEYEFLTSGTDRLYELADSTRLLNL